MGISVQQPQIECAGEITTAGPYELGTVVRVKGRGEWAVVD